MTWLDGTLLLIVALSALYGVMRGFVREVLSLLGWVLSFWLATKYAALLADEMVSLLPGAGLRYIVAFVLLCLGGLLATALSSSLLSRLVSLGGLGGLDRIAGVFFGMVRGVVIAVLVLAVVRMTPLAVEPVWHRSMSVAVFEPGWRWVIETTQLQDQLAIYREALWQ